MSIQVQKSYRLSLAFLPATPVRPNTKAKYALARLRRAHAIVAKLVIRDTAYVPIFERLEAEITDVQTEIDVTDPIVRARAIAAAHRRISHA